jgi:Ca2+/H+ antiporter, TMEM165/GDT1 family
MTGFFLALLACLAVELPGRDGLRVAQLAARLGSGPGLLAAVWISAIATTALAVFAATLIAPAMPGPARQMLVAFALALAALELSVRRAPRAPSEPTRSTGAMLLVLLAAQLTDGARLIVLALAVATKAPLAVAAGGALASGAALTVAALAASHWPDARRLRPVRLAVAGVLLVFGIVTGLDARGLLG